MASRFAVCPRQEGNDPQFSLLSPHKDAAMRSEVVSPLKYFVCTRHFERSRPTFSSAFAPANASACGCEKSLFLFRSLAQRDRFLSAVCMEKSVFFILDSAVGAPDVSPARQGWETLDAVPSQ